MLDDHTQTVGARRIQIGNNRLWLVNNMRDSAGMRYSSLRVLSLAKPQTPTYLWDALYGWPAGYNGTEDALIEADTAYLAMGNYYMLGRAELAMPSNRNSISILERITYSISGSDACTQVTSDSRTRWLLTLQPSLNDSAVVLLKIRRKWRHAAINNERAFTRFGLPNPTRPHRAVLLDSRQLAVMVYQQEGIQIWSLADSARPVRMSRRRGIGS